MNGKKKIYALQKGREIVDQINQVFVDSEKQLLQGLTEDERTEFMRLLKKNRSEFVR